MASILEGFDTIKWKKNLFEENKHTQEESKKSKSVKAFFKSKFYTEFINSDGIDTHAYAFSFIHNYDTPAHVMHVLFRRRETEAWFSRQNVVSDTTCVLASVMFDGNDFVVKPVFSQIIKSPTNYATLRDGTLIMSNPSLSSPPFFATFIKNQLEVISRAEVYGKISENRDSAILFCTTERPLKNLKKQRNAAVVFDDFLSIKSTQTSTPAARTYNDYFKEQEANSGSGIEIPITDYIRMEVSATTSTTKSSSASIVYNNNLHRPTFTLADFNFFDRFEVINDYVFNTPKQIKQSFQDLVDELASTNLGNGALLCSKDAPEIAKKYYAREKLIEYVEDFYAISRTKVKSQSVAKILKKLHTEPEAFYSYLNTSEAFNSHHKMLQFVSILDAPTVYRACQKSSNFREFVSETFELSKLLFESCFVLKNRSKAHINEMLDAFQTFDSSFKQTNVSIDALHDFISFYLLHDNKLLSTEQLSCVLTSNQDSKALVEFALDAAFRFSKITDFEQSILSNSKNTNLLIAAKRCMDAKIDVKYAVDIAQNLSAFTKDILSTLTEEDIRTLTSTIELQKTSKSTLRF